MMHLEVRELFRYWIAEALRELGKHGGVEVSLWTAFSRLPFTVC